MNKDRLEVVRSLIEFSHPLDLVTEQIRSFEWDYEGQPVELTSQHLIKVLNTFIDGKMSANDVEKWANLVEGREDISFESASKKLIEQVMHELANPVITTPLDKNRAKKLITDFAEK